MSSQKLDQAVMRSIKTGRLSRWPDAAFYPQQGGEPRPWGGLW